MNIAVDLDDVVMEFWSGVINSVNLEYDLDLDPADTPNWADNHLKRLDVFGEGKTWWDWLQENPSIWATLKPVHGAIGGIRTLRSQGHYVELLTSKPRWAEWTVWKWLGRWKVPFNSVTIVPTGESKPNWSRCHLLVDDRDKNLQEWHKAWRPAICFQRPWSNVGELPDRVGVTSTWAGVLDQIESYRQSGRFLNECG